MYVCTVHGLIFCQFYVILNYIIGPKMNNLSDNIMYQPFVDDKYRAILLVSLTVFKFTNCKKLNLRDLNFDKTIWYSNFLTVYYY